MYFPFFQTNAGTLLLIDSEEEYYKDEIMKLDNDIHALGLSVIIFSDWYDINILNSVKFFDENTRDFWEPATGGSNIPAINDLLKPFNIAFGGKVLRGDIDGGTNPNNQRPQKTIFRSGNEIIQFPVNGHIYRTRLIDESSSFLNKGKNKIVEAAVFGLYQTLSKNTSSSGRIVVYGDSNCIDSSHIVSPCYWLLLEFLKYTSDNVLTPTINKMTHEVTELDTLYSNHINTLKPRRRKESMYVMKHLASKVLNGKVGDSCTNN